MVFVELIPLKPEEHQCYDSDENALVSRLRVGYLVCECSEFVAKENSSFVYVPCSSRDRSRVVFNSQQIFPWSHRWQARRKLLLLFHRCIRQTMLYLSPSRWIEWKMCRYPCHCFRRIRHCCKPSTCEQTGSRNGMCIGYGAITFWNGTL